VVPNHDGVLLCLTLCRHRGRAKRSRDGSNLDAHHDRISIVDAHAVEFSKTAKPRRKCFLQRSPSDPAPGGACGPTGEYSASSGTTPFLRRCLRPRERTA